MINALRDKYRLKVLLKALDMAKSSYCYQENAISGPDKYKDLRVYIKDIFSKVNVRYGYRRIYLVLKKSGKTVSEKVVRWIMKKEHLIVPSVKKKEYSTYIGEISPEVENVINRDFNADKPNEKWLTDLTDEFHISAGKVYLSPMTDCFDGLAVAWTISTSPDANLANAMLEEAKEGAYTLWSVKLDAPSERVALGNFPQAGEIYIHKGKFYFRSYLQKQLLSMDVEGKVEVVKPYLYPDSAVCFFDQYAILPTAGQVSSNHCDADLLDLNTGGLIPYGAYLHFTFWRAGTPFNPGENKVWHEEVSEQTSTPHGKAIRFYFTEDGLAIEYALVNPTTNTVKFRAMDWSVTCNGCEQINFANFINVDVAPKSEYVFSMVFPEVPDCNLTESGFDYKVQLRFD